VDAAGVGPSMHLNDGICLQIHSECMLVVICWLLACQRGMHNHCQ
jgi:hypothetical protein